MFFQLWGAVSDTVLRYFADMNIRADLDDAVTVMRGLVKHASAFCTSDSAAKAVVLGYEAGAE